MALPLMQYNFTDADKTNPNAEHGFNNGKKKEASNDLEYNVAPCEDVWSNENNAWIVLGRDRPAQWSSGYGGAGHDRCGSIDIVVGRLSALNLATLDGKVNPSPFADASRIYISQKADIDEYYKLAPGRTGISATGKAAIAIKSDDIRILARNTLKIITGVENTVSRDTKQKVINTTGVQLIANNDSDPNNLQPIPKGTNLINFFNILIEQIQKLTGLVTGLAEIQMQYNKALAMHTHRSPFYAQIGSPILGEDFKVANIDVPIQMYLKICAGVKAYCANLTATSTEYLAPGEKFINSSFHFLN